EVDERRVLHRSTAIDDPRSNDHTLARDRRDDVAVEVGQDIYRELVAVQERLNDGIGDVFQKELQLLLVANRERPNSAAAGPRPDEQWKRDVGRNTTGHERWRDRKTLC